MRIVLPHPTLLYHFFSQVLECIVGLQILPKFIKILWNNCYNIVSMLTVVIQNAYLNLAVWEGLNSFRTYTQVAPPTNREIPNTTSVLKLSTSL